MSTPALDGLIPIVPTPFDERGAVDPEALKRVLDYLIEVGVHGVAVLGMASEAITLTDAERDVVISTTAERVAGRVPVVTGCSHNSSHAVAQLAVAAEGSGADALMVMPPAIGNPDRSALREYFATAADATGLAVMIQDNPGWHGVSIPIELYADLAAIPNIRYAKIETPHPPTTMTAVRDAVGDKLTLVGGQAGSWLPEELRRGTVGTMPASIMPQVYLLILKLWQEGRESDAIAVFDHYHPLIRVTSSARVGIGMAKAMLRIAGVLANDSVRDPFPTLSDADRGDLTAVMDRLRITEIMRGEVDAAHVLM